MNQRARATKESLNQEVGDKKEFKKQKTVKKPLTAQEKHQIYLKFQGECGYLETDGRKCNQQRFLEIHHKKPVAQGGSNDPSNLILLCSGHHKVMHTQQ